MKKHIIAVSVLSLMAAAPALAQTTSPAPTAPPEKMEQPNTYNSPSATDVRKPGDLTDSKSSLAKDKTAMSSGGSWRASNLIGAAVVNSANESIGDINDLLVDGSGRIDRVVVGVGGFLGIGEKNVALQFDELTLARGNDGNAKVMSKATKQSLEAAAEWKPSKSKM
ncbi:MAG: PRC-barrel domain-containing protein [Hyphomicrobiaceae bacterium]|nr:PRC-barrel domain-containing protein [Hyphomicrobiaceae bacterium]